MPAFDLKLVPYLWTVRPDSAAVDFASEMAADGEQHQLLWQTANLLPICEFNVSAHEPKLTTSNNISDLVRDVEVVRVMESGTDHYMAMLTGEKSGPRGIAYAGGRATDVWVRSNQARSAQTIAHELEHSLNRWHAPCGVPADQDPDYPFRDGSTGAWGIDTRSGQEVLVSPLTADLMGYCHPAWIGPYHLRRRRVTITDMQRMSPHLRPRRFSSPAARTTTASRS